MFFALRKRQKSAGGASHPSDPAANEAGERQSRQWQTWRRSAQKVTRAWNEWLAGGSRECPELYRRYISALAEEERAAAAIEQTVNLGANAQDPRTSIAPTTHTGANDASYR
jgi:hypothetical protein